MKTLISLLTFAFLIVSPAHAQQPADLKSSVATWFTTDQSAAGFTAATKDGLRDKTVPSKFKIGDLADGKAHSAISRYVRGDGWAKFATTWQGQLVGLAKNAKDTPEDRTLLAALREAHKALEEAKTDKAKVDTALRKLADLRARAR